MTQPNLQQNVDLQEVQKFTDLANEWWDKSGAFATLHQINPLRLNWIEQQTIARQQSGLTGKKVLDVGCGGGILSHSMAMRGATVTGIDLGEANIKAAQIHAEQTSQAIDFACVAVEDFAKAHAGEFDVVTCMEMLEHVPDPASIIQACQTLVKPGGHVFFSTINRNPKSYLFAIIGAEYVLRMLAKGTHDYHKFIKPSELAHDIRNAGLTLKDMTGLHFNPLTKRYWLAPNVDVNYMVYTVKAGAE